ncbi:MAG: hypothetical protein P4L87_05705 [Formivibrio sp.]|nr:hypothetical protein [Formivibrio sp.]
MNAVNTENQNSYEAAEQCFFTRFETKPTGDYLLPYSGLLFARLTPASEGEILTLTYITHTVTITGSKLSALLQIIHRGRAETIRVASSEADGNPTPSVRGITITEAHQESGDQ